MKTLQETKQDIVREYGPWTATNLDLGDGVFTMDGAAPRIQPNIVRFGQAIQDVLDRPLATARILDLACLEGEYALELARQGAEVLGVEGREANIAKARFVKEALKLDRLHLVHDDVRNLSREKYGTFDAVICSGILYHLAAEDQLPFIERLAEVCKRCLIVDTHVAPRPSRKLTHKGTTYAGSVFIEHHRRSSRAERERSLWASLDNQTSFWLTRRSLYNAIILSGFSSVYECHMPPSSGRPPDRTTLVGIKGTRYVPATHNAPLPPLSSPERVPPGVLYHLRGMARSMVMRLPYPITRALRSLFGKR